jgi:hypothetical protein
MSNTILFPVLFFDQKLLQTYKKCWYKINFIRKCFNMNPMILVTYNIIKMLLNFFLRIKKFLEIFVHLIHLTGGSNKGHDGVKEATRSEQQLAARLGAMRQLDDREQKILRPPPPLCGAYSGEHERRRTTTTRCERAVPVGGPGRHPRQAVKRQGGAMCECEPCQ